jgi:copper chaperone
MSNTTELKIDGMTCGHCVAAVTKALQAVPGVERAEVSLAEGRATVTHEGSLDTKALIAAVEEEGYSAKAAEAASEGSGCACCRTDSATR